LEFRLIYEGEIQPRQRAKLPDIHNIRREIHEQLKQLWTFDPLVTKKKWLQLPDAAEEYPNGSRDYAILEQVGSRTYAPLISKRCDLVGELNILFLRPQAPGQLISEGGDLDNRVKTLLDALRAPSRSEVNTLGTITDGDEDPLFCVFQDDALITKVSIETDRLLRGATGRELVAMIQVRVRASKVTHGTIDLLS
jgi:hypothetical protein